MKKSVKRMLLWLMTTAILMGVFSERVLASGFGEYPYANWDVVNQCSAVENTTSQADMVWKTLYGTVTAQELIFGDLRYWVYLPEEYNAAREYPLVVYLHGSNVSYNQGNETPWSNTLNRAACRVADGLHEVLGDYILLAPQAPSTTKGTVSGSGWSNMAGSEWKSATEDTSGASHYLKAAEKLMAGYMNDGVLYDDDTYAVNANRVYLIGDSMGAIGAYAMLQDCPAVFSAVMVRAGIGNPYTVEAWKNTPIRIFHGTIDQNVLYESSTKMLAALETVGAKDAQLIAVKYGSHDIRANMYRTIDEKGVNVYLSWLACQNKSDYNITNEADYYQLRAAVNEGGAEALTYVGEKVGRVVTREECAALNVSLGADITLTESVSGIGTTANPFSGTFDGNRYTVTFDGITSSGDAAVNVSLFGYVVDGTIRNVELAGAVSYIDTALKFASERDREETGDYIGPLCSRITGNGSVCDVSSSVDITYTNEGATSRKTGEVLVTGLLGLSTVPAVGCVINGNVQITNMNVKEAGSLDAILMLALEHLWLLASVLVVLIILSLAYRRKRS